MLKEQCIFDNNIRQTNFILTTKNHA